MAVNIQPFKPKPFNAGADPFVRELETLLSGQSQAEKSARDAAIARAVGAFGVVPNFSQFGIKAPPISDTATALAEQATEQGVSTIARMREQVQQARRQTRDQLAARGILSSGETPFQLGEIQKAFTRSQFDASRQLVDYISGAMAAFAQAERQRGQQRLGVRQEARLRDEQRQREDYFRAQDIAIRKAERAQDLAFARQQLALDQQAMAAAAAPPPAPAADPFGGGGFGGPVGPTTFTGQTNADGTGIYMDTTGALWTLLPGGGWAPSSGGAAPAPTGPLADVNTPGEPSPWQQKKAGNIRRRAARHRTDAEKQWLRDYNSQFPGY